jgi:hypothetical protein
MKKAIYTIALMVAFVACEEDENRIFEKTADERAAEAIANLKQDLIAPTHGWKIKYTPQDGAGSYHVLLDFKEDNKVTIQSDLGADDGAYFEQTISYRIDNSLGLELILENYSFFSFLFELDQATFGAEYEFDYVNKTPDNALVFRSKTDISTPDVIVFEEAGAGDKSLLGTGVSLNLNTLSEDFDKFTSSVRMVYQNKDLVLYISLDALRRTFTVTSASLKGNTQTVQSINFTTPYLLQGNSIIFETALETTILGNPVSMSSLQLNTFGETTLSLCAEPMTLHNYAGVTSASDPVLLETSLIDVTGGSFTTSNFYFTPLVYIFNNGESMGEQIPMDIAGALELHMYYGLQVQSGDILYGIGFVIRNPDGTITFALREFTPEVNGNNIKFNFAADISIFGEPTSANVENVKIYLDALAQGDNTYIFRLNQGIYEFYNPCSGWSFVLIDANR